MAYDVLAMTARVARHRACALATAAALVPFAGCTFEALGQGATPQGLSTTTTDAEPTGSSSEGSSSGTGGPPDATSGEPDTTQGASSGESGDDAESTGDPPPEFPSGPFGEAEPVSLLNGPATDEDDPALSPDGRELYFEVTPMGGTGDIWVARRTSTDADWGAPTLVPGISIELYNDGAPGLTESGLTMLFISDRPGSFSNDIYVTHRDGPKLPWEAPTRVDMLSSYWSDVGPRPVPGGNGMFLCSDRQVAGAVGLLDLWLVEQTDFERGVYSEPAIVAPLSTSGEECMLMMGANELEVFFDSDRLPSVGQHDLWSATRESVEVQLGAPVPLQNVNSGTEERDPFLSPDGHELYFSSNRDGSMDLFVARR